jgi:PqqD family protein of HPr-rel-A system
MAVYARTAGARVEPVGHLWVAFSATSGETALLNDESAAILEVLEAGPAPTDAVCAALGSDIGVSGAELHDTVEASWPRLIDAGLVRMLPGMPAAATDAPARS